jgi:hypothetical protein
MRDPRVAVSTTVMTEMENVLASTLTLRSEEEGEEEEEEMPWPV